MAIKKYPSELIAQALKDSRGLISVAAKAIGCNTETIYRRIDDEPELHAILMNSRCRLVDKAEVKLEKAIDEDDLRAILFTLKTLGKERGFVERTEVHGSHNVTMYGKEAPTDSV